MNKNITTEFRNGDIIFNFLNGPYKVPDSPGGYVVASGCGSGKTTAIRSLISQKFSSGVLYAASTIEECDLMYEYCKELVSSINDSSILSLKDIIVLHSNNKSEGTDANTWRNDPLKIRDKKIVICTHHKLLNEDLRLLMPTSFVRSDTDDVIGSAMLPGGPLPRQYVLIDELPTCSPFKLSITKDKLNLLARRIIHEERRDDGTVISSSMVGLEKPTSFRELLDYHRMFSKLLNLDTGLDPGGYKVNLIMSTIYRNFDRYMKLLEVDPDRSIVVSFNIADLLVPGMTSRILLFDGTGDITFGNGSKDPSKSLVMGTRPKEIPLYNSDLDIRRFRFGVTRRLTKSDLHENYKNLKDSVKELIRIINENSRTLIVTWMNLKEGDKLDISKVIKGATESDLNILNLLGNLDLKSYYTEELLKSGVTPDRFSIIHYQSGLDKATNQFMDHDSIVFLGEFHVPNSVVAEFRDTFRTNTSSEEYQAYQVIQAICRTRIRLHNGEKIRIYFSDDWNESFSLGVGSYLVSSSSIISESKSEILLEYSLDNIVKRKWKDQVRILVDEFPSLRTYIVDYYEGRKSSKYELVVSLDRIFQLLPRTQKQVRSYYPLMNYLEKIGIQLIIPSK